MHSWDEINLNSLLTQLCDLLRCQDWTLTLLCSTSRLVLLHRCMTFVSETTSPMPSLQRFSFSFYKCYLAVGFVLLPSHSVKRWSKIVKESQALMSHWASKCWPIYQVHQKSSSLKNFANFFKNYREVWHKILCPSYSFPCSQIWEVSLRSLQNWQNYAAFSHGSLTVMMLTKIVSTIQDIANTGSLNTFFQ